MIWPNLPFKKCNFEIERSVKAFSNSFTNSQQQVDFAGTFWEAEVELAWLSRVQAGELLGLLAEHGRSGILLPDAAHAQPAGVGGGNPVTAGENQGGVVRVANAPESLPGWLRSGDLIQIGNHMHMLTRDANTDGEGNATLYILPYLRSLPNAGTSVITENCACLMQLEANEKLPRRVSPRKRYLAELKLKFVEVIG